jgi:hypothetical protein
VTLALSKTYEEAASFLEDRFSKYLEVGPEPALVRAAYDYDPYNFGGKFPALSVEEVGSSYEGASDRSKLPGTMLLAVRIYDVALSRQSTTTEKWRDGRAQAKRRCREVWGAWLEQLNNDKELRKLVRAAEPLTTEAGDADALGNSRLDETGRHVLWTHRANLRVLL